MPLLHKPVVLNDGGGATAATSANSAKTVHNAVSSSNSGGYVSSGSGFGTSYDYLREISGTNNAFNLEQTEMVNAFNAAEAQKQRDWLERMSRNAHKYEIEDLKNSGLNPVLSAGGQGAYVGSAAAATGQKAVADNTFGNGVVQLMSAAMSAASAERVAQIYAAAQMYGADKTYDYNKSYQQVLAQNNLRTTATSAENASKSGWFGLGEAALGILGRVLYGKMSKKTINNYGLY